MCKICSKLTVKTPEYVMDLVQVSLLLTLNGLTHCSGIFIVDIEQIHGGWVNCYPKSLTNFTSGFHFYTHENRKPKVFRGIKLEHWPEVGLLIQFYLKHFFSVPLNSLLKSRSIY